MVTVNYPAEQTGNIR